MWIPGCQTYTKEAVSRVGYACQTYTKEAISGVGRIYGCLPKESTSLTVIDRHPELGKSFLYALTITVHYRYYLKYYSGWST